MGLEHVLEPRTSAVRGWDRNTHVNTSVNHSENKVRGGANGLVRKPASLFHLEIRLKDGSASLPQ